MVAAFTKHIKWLTVGAGNFADPGSTGKKTLDPGSGSATLGAGEPMRHDFNNLAK
jgi:hypothetical protein